MTADPALGRAIAAHLRAALGMDVPASCTPCPENAVLVTTPSDCSTERCRELAGEGRRVIVVSPSVRSGERDAYLAAGAHAHIPMVVDTTELVEAVRGALASTR